MNSSPAAEDYPKLELTFPSELAETAVERLWELDTIGVQEYPAIGGSGGIVAWFSPQADPETLRHRLTAALPTSEGFHWTIGWESCDPTAWVRRFSESFSAFPATGAFYVHPPWQPPSPEYPYNLVIEPGLGFGTGSHESTMLMLEGLEQTAGRASEILDVGTGSGILAVAALRVNPKARVAALDIDALAVGAARRTCLQNEVTPWLLLAGECSTVRHRFDLVLANLTYSLLLSLSGELSRLARCRLLISGFTYDQAPALWKELEQSAGFRVEQSWVRNGWAAALLNR